MSDPEIVALREVIAKRVRSDDIAQRRRDIDARGLAYKLPPDVIVGPVDASGVKAEWTTTPDADRSKAVLYLHGGGYVIGTYDMDGATLDRWCLELGVVGVSVQYRLAPETPYPGPIDDCYAALQWAYEHAAELGVDRDAIGVYGLSAGGGLAAALALLARDRGKVPLAFQLLDCPMLDDRGGTPSIRARGLRMWKADSNEFGWRSYLGRRYGTDDVPPYAAAARATDLSGLPPSCIVVGAIDGFRDEDVDYASRLNQAGVPCELHVIAGLPHAYLLAPEAPAVQLAERCKGDWLARQLARLGA